MFIDLHSGYLCVGVCYTCKADCRRLCILPIANEKPLVIRVRQPRQDRAVGRRHRQTSRKLRPRAHQTRHPGKVLLHCKFLKSVTMRCLAYFPLYNLMSYSLTVTVSAILTFFLCFLKNLQVCFRGHTHCKILHKYCILGCHMHFGHITICKMTNHRFSKLWLTGGCRVTQH